MDIINAIGADQTRGTYVYDERFVIHDYGDDTDHDTYDDDDDDAGDYTNDGTDDDSDDGGRVNGRPLLACIFPFPPADL